MAGSMKFKDKTIVHGATPRIVLSLRAAVLNLLRSWGLLWARLETEMIWLIILHFSLRCFLIYAESLQIHTMLSVLLVLCIRERYLHKNEQLATWHLHDNRFPSILKSLRSILIKSRAFDCAQRAVNIPKSQEIKAETLFQSNHKLNIGVDKKWKIRH